MIIAPLKKLNTSFFFKKTPIFSITVIQLMIIFGAINLSAASAALFLNKPSSNNPVGQTSAEQKQEISETGFTPEGGRPSNEVSEQQSSTSQSSNSTSRNQTTCKTEVIPFKTTYQNVSYLKKGQTQESGGHNGSLLDCGDGNPTILNPVDKTIYVGTGLTDAEIEQQKIAAQQEYDRQYMLWIQKRTNAYQSCMGSLPQNYPNKESYCTSQASQQAGPPPKQP